MSDTLHGMVGNVTVTISRADSRKTHGKYDLFATFIHLMSLTGMNALKIHNNLQCKKEDGKKELGKPCL